MNKMKMINYILITIFFILLLVAYEINKPKTFWNKMEVYDYSIYHTEEKITKTIKNRRVIRKFKNILERANIEVADLECLSYYSILVLNRKNNPIHAIQLWVCDNRIEFLIDDNRTLTSSPNDRRSILSVEDTKLLRKIIE